jgi:hypothetical protein
MNVRYQISLHNTKLKNVVSSGTSKDEFEGVAAYRRPVIVCSERGFGASYGPPRASRIV